MHFAADEVAHSDGSHFLAHALDDSAKLMTEGERRPDARSRPSVPSIDVEVGAADGGGAHTHQNLRGANRGNGDGRKLCTPRGARLAQGLHRGGRHQGTPENTRTIGMWRLFT